MSGIVTDTFGTPAPPGPGSGGLELRGYQEEGLADIRALMRQGYRWILYTLPTGGGKTTIFCRAAAIAAAQGIHVAVLCHRVEILRQVASTFARLGVHCGLVAAGEPEDIMAPVQVCSVATLWRRVAKGRYHGVFRLVIIDEAHHAICPVWERTVPVILEEGGRVVGVTATPLRLSGEGLDWFPVPPGEAPRRAFEVLTCGPDIAWLRDHGYLCKAETYLPGNLIDTTGVRLRGGDFDQCALIQATLRQGGIIGDAIEHYRRLAAGKPMLAFCCSIEHSQLTAKAFNAAGIAAAHVDGETRPDIRADAIAAIVDGRLQVLTSCAIFVEGLDLPGIHGIIALRPTCSFGLHRQMIGRALRPASGKTKALILDHAANTLRHGLYDTPIEWSLSGRQREKRDNSEAPVRRCPECGAANRLGAASCEACGYGFTTEGRQGRVPETRDGRLERVEDELTFRLRQMSYEALLRWAGSDGERLASAAMARGYKPGWVRIRQLEHREALRRAGEGAI